MERRRWPDVVVVVGVLLVLCTGVWAIWGKDLEAWWHPPTKQTEDAKTNSGTT